MTWMLRWLQQERDNFFFFLIKQHFIDSYSPLEEEMFTILDNKAILVKETAITKAEHIEKQR